MKTFAKYVILDYLTEHFEILYSVYIIASLMSLTVDCQALISF